VVRGEGVRVRGEECVVCGVWCVMRSVCVVRECVCVVRSVCVVYSQRDTLGAHDVGLEAQHGEHHQRGEDGGEEVDEGHQHGVEVAVVVALVVAGEGDDAAEAQAQSEEHLRGRLAPHLGLQHDLQLRGGVRGHGQVQGLNTTTQRVNHKKGPER